MRPFKSPTPSESPIDTFRRSTKLRRVVRFFFLGTSLFLLAALIGLKQYLTPERLTQWTQTAWSETFLGILDVEEVAWRFPAKIYVKNIRIRANVRQTRDDLTIRRAHAALSIPSLLRRQIRFTNFGFEQTNIELYTAVSQQQDPNRTWRLLDNFAPRQKKPPTQALETQPNWRVLIDHLEIRNLNVHINAPEGLAELCGFQGTFDNIHYNLVDGDLALTLQIATDAVRLQPQHMPAEINLGAFGLGAKTITWRKNDTAQQFAITALQFQAPGISLTGDSQIHILPTKEPQIDVDLWGDADFSTPLWQLLMPHAGLNLSPTLQKSAIRAHITGKHDSGQHLEIDVHAKDPSQQAFGLDAAGILLAWNTPQLKIQRAYFRRGTEEMLLRAELTFNMQAQSIAIDKHFITLTSEKFPLAQVLGPLTSQPWLPETLQQNIRIQGEKLWPQPISRIELKTQASQIHLNPDIHIASCSLVTQIEANKTAVQVQHFQTNVDGLKLLATGFFDIQKEKPFQFDAQLSTSHTPKFLNAVLASNTLGAIESEIHLSGTPNAPELHGFFLLNDLRPSFNSHIQLDASTKLTMTHGRMRLSKIKLSDSKRTTRIRGFLQAQIQDSLGNWDVNPIIDGEIRLAQFNLAAWFPKYAGRGDATANVLLSGSAQHPRLNGWLRVASPKIDNVAFQNVDMAFTANEHLFDLQQITLTPDLGGTIRGRAQYDFSSAMFDTDWLMHNVPLRWLTQSEGNLPDCNASLFARGSHTHSDLQFIFQIPDGMDIKVNGTIRPQDKLLDLTLRGYTELELLSAFLPENLHFQGHWVTDIRAQGPWRTPTIDLFSNIQKMTLNKSPLGDQTLTLVAHNVAPTKYRLMVDALGVAHTMADLSLDRNIDIHSKTRWDIEKVTSWFPNFEAQGMDLRSSGQMLASFSQDQTGNKPITFDIELELERLELEAGGQSAMLQAPAILRANASKVQLSSIKIAGSAADLIYDASIQGPWTKTDAAQQSQTHLKSDANGGIELGFLAQWLPSLGQTNGVLRFSHRLRGTCARPEHRGKIYLSSPVQILPRGGNMQINVNQGTLELDPKQIQIQDVRGQIGEGVFVLRGNIGLQNWLPNHYKVQFDAQGLPFSSDNLVLEANAHIEAKGSGRYPKLLGTIDILRGRFLKQLRFEDFNFMGEKQVSQQPVAERLPWLQALQLDLHATNSTGFTVKFDAGIFGVSAILNADLHITQNALHPRVVGRIAAEQGSLQFPKAKLQLTQAALDLEPTLDDKLGGVIIAQADGEVTSPISEPGGGVQTYQIGLHAEGPLHAPVIEFTSDQGLGKLEILSLLTTGYVALTDLVSGGSSQGSQLDAALAFAGSQISGPLTRLAEKQLERALNLQLEIGAEFTQSQVRVVAAKNFNRRLRLEGSYSHAFSEEQSSIATRAQLALTDRFLFEGTAARDLTGASTAANGDSIQSNLELKLRLLGH